MKTVFLDSDVLLDLTLKRPDFVLPMLNLIDLIQNGKLKAVTSPIVFVNVNYFLNKYNRPNKTSLLGYVRSILNIIEVDETTIDKALKSGITNFEDAVQYHAALTANADFIITRNIKDYKQATIPVLTAEQFLRTLS